MSALRALPAYIAEEEQPLYDLRPRPEKRSSEPSPVNMFGMVPVTVFGVVDPGAVCVYAALTQYARPDGHATASVDVLVSLIRTISRPTVMKHIQALASAGLIIISERKRGASRAFEYFLPQHPSVKKIDRSDINDTTDRSKNLTGDDATGQESLPVTGQKTLPVEPGNNDDRSKNLTGTGQNSLPAPVKKLDRLNVNDKEDNEKDTGEAAPPEPISDAFGGDVPPPAPAKALPMNGPAQRLVAWWCDRIGEGAPADYGKAVGQAQKLYNAGIKTPTDAGSLYDYCLTQLSGGITLGSMLACLDGWKASKARPATARGKTPSSYDPYTTPDL